MSARAPLRLRVLGAGRVGSALASLLAGAGCDVVDFWTRSEGRARVATRDSGLPCRWGALESAETPAAQAAADVTIVAVRDDAVGEFCSAAAALLERAPIVLHVGGARSAAEALANAPAALERGTMHPLAAVSSVEQARRVLPSVVFAVEGDDGARHAARRLVGSVGARTLELEAEQMVRYHTAAVLASNLAVALWSEAAALLAATGVDEGLEVLMPLIRSTVDNVATLGLPDALTGPVRRGDWRTVAQHVEALTQHFPRILPLYRAGSRAALALAEEAIDAPSDADVAQLRRLLRR